MKFFSEGKATDAELQCACISRAEYERLNQHWHERLAEIEPDERERIQENPTGNEAVALAVTVLSDVLRFK